MTDPDDKPVLDTTGGGGPTRPLPPPPTLGELVDVGRQRFVLRHPSFDATYAVLVVAAVAGLGGMVWALITARGEAGPVDPVRVVAPSTAPSTTGATSTTTPSTIVVDVAGAVTRPGPVRVPAGARVVDAIAAAGGARTDADLERVVRAARLVDGQRVYVPRRGQTEIPAVVDPTGVPDPPGGGATGGDGPIEPATPVGGPVNLNTADVATLDTLPGVGPATAQAIIDHRDRNGPFGSVDDLLAVKGIGPAKLAELRDRVTV